MGNKGFFVLVAFPLKKIIVSTSFSGHKTLCGFHSKFYILRKVFLFFNSSLINLESISLPHGAEFHVKSIENVI